VADRDGKRRLYEAALELMGRQGIASTSTREILAAAKIRNPSAISYHFGSKAGLVDALAAELAGGQHPILGLQTQLVADGARPTAAEWVAPVVDTAIALVQTERGCLLARLWWEYDGYLNPQSLERFVGGDSETATSWRAALSIAFPDLPPSVGVARSVTVLRTMGWMLSRMAQMNLAEEPFVVRKHTRFRMFVEEISVTLMTGPTNLEDEDLSGRIKPAL
jgi:TetR/AcrR family transcriptional regulator, regulator of cefoperazone and chloramphenicol sensitivity